MYAPRSPYRFVWRPRCASSTHNRPIFFMYEPTKMSPLCLMESTSKIKVVVTICIAMQCRQCSMVTQTMAAYWQASASFCLRSLTHQRTRQHECCHSSLVFCEKVILPRSNRPVCAETSVVLQPLYNVKECTK